jgi:plasmid stabilization system protein ParE
MPRKIIYTLEAEEDYDSAVDYYEQKRDGLGFEFVERMIQAENFIKNNPKACQKINDKYPYRRYVMNQFPYSIFYQENEGIIKIVAISGQSQKPKF